MLPDLSKILALILALACLVPAAPLSAPAATFTVDLTGGDVNTNINGGVGDDTIDVTGSTGRTASGNWDGGGGTNTLTWTGDGTLDATVNNIQVLNLRGNYASITLDTSINLGATGVATITQSEVILLGGRTLTTNSLFLKGDDPWFDIRGTVTVNGGAGTIWGSNDYTELGVYSTGVLNANVNLGGGNNDFYLMAGGTVNGVINGGSGDDDWLNLVGGPAPAVLTGTYINFERLYVYGFAEFTLNTDIDLTGHGYGELVLELGSLTIATGRTLNTYYTYVDFGSLLTLDPGSTINTVNANIEDGSAVGIEGTFNANYVFMDELGEVYVLAGGTLATYRTEIGPDDGYLFIEAGGTFTFTYLTVNGFFESELPFTVPAGTFVNGTGVMIGAIINNGTIMPGASIGTLTIGGTYTHNAGGILEVEIDPSGTHDQLLVSTGGGLYPGTATINGGTLRVVPRTGYYRVGTRFDVLLAEGGLAGTFTSVVDGIASARLVFTAEYDANTVWVVLAKNSFTSLMTGSPQGQRAVAGFLDRIENGAVGDMRAVIGRLDMLTLSQLEDAVGQLHGLVYDAFSYLAYRTDALLFSAIQARLDELRLGAGDGQNPWANTMLARVIGPEARAGHYSTAMVPGAGGREEADNRTTSSGRLGLFLRASGAIGDRDSNDQRIGFRYDATSITAGLDYRFRPGLIGGISLGWARTGVTYDDTGSSRAKVESLALGLYGAWYTRRFHLVTAVSLARNDYHMDRRIVFPGLDRTAAADYYGWQLSAHLGGGYDLVSGPTWRFGPTASLSYVFLDQDRFTETGAGALNLTVDRQQTHSIKSTLGIRAVKTVKRSWGTVKLSGRAAWVHEFAADARGITAFMEGAPGTTFTVNTADPDRDALRLGLGLVIKPGQRMSFFLRYRAEVASNYQTHGGMIGFRITF